MSDPIWGTAPDTQRAWGYTDMLDEHIVLQPSLCAGALSVSEPTVPAWQRAAAALGAAALVVTAARSAAVGVVVELDRVAQPLERRRPTDPLAGLTPREREVLGLIAEGLSDRGIARMLVTGWWRARPSVRGIATADRGHLVSEAQLLTALYRGRTL